jgi:hypothetical protein
MTYVCDACVEDVELAKFVRANLCSTECDYCLRESDENIAADMSDLAEHVRGMIEREWTDPVNELPYDSREGGYQGIVIGDPYELFAEIEFELDDARLLEDLCEYFWTESWCQRNYFSLSPPDRLRYGWTNFKDVVKHHRRFTFWQSNEDSEEFSHPDNLPSSQMMRELAQVLQCAPVTYVVTPAETIWRVRIHDSKKVLSTPNEFTSPPLSKAIFSNRMSPAGVPMFYGSTTFDTAALETINPERATLSAIVTGAAFQPTRDLIVLDLSSRLDPPSFFSPDPRLRYAINFLNHFSSDISQPIVKDGREHVDYVPTQVFTEFIRYELPASDGVSYDGIKYASSRNGLGCYVIFADQAACLEPQEGGSRGHSQLLRFVPDSIDSKNAIDVVRS